MINNSSEKKYAVALGYFDGLHLAHRAVINEAVKYENKGYIPAVMLFSEHPRKVISGDDVPFLLQKEKRDELLSLMGVKPLFVSFSEIKDMSPEEFIEKILINKFNVGAVTCGYNYRFGKNGVGDSEKLLEICKQHNIEAVVCTEITLDGENVSSTKIRNAVTGGEIEKANKMLGFTFGFSSRIFTGDKRGRLLGTPTINQFLPEGLIVPRFGVYASRVYFDGNEYIGVTNIGSRPTFDGESVRSETYIIGFNGDLYGKTVEIKLHKFIREEKKFPDGDTLKAQISRDIKVTEEHFTSQNKKI
ncbi:MAG: bifunctional riboflavin kinase/FAD synthetase [Clostridia bacterium]|nr:bifunctional riboflavin kinase/FAD synthetase [Clostridia bacterium]